MSINVKMNIIESLQTLWGILIIILLVFRYKYGLVAALSYFILVPMEYFPGLKGVSWEHIEYLILFAFIVANKHQRIKQVNIKPFIPILLYFIVSLLFMFFQNDTPLDYELKRIKRDFILCLILPFVLWNQMLNDKMSAKLFRRAFVICIFIIALYGLFLTTMPGVNPYIMLVNNIMGFEYKDDYLGDTNRLFGRITSVFMHPMTFGCFLGLSLIFVYSVRSHLKKAFFVSLFLLICIDIVVCGVRSVVAAILVAIVFYFFQARNYKIMAYAIIIGTVFYNIILQIPDMTEYLSSMSLSSNSEIGGSSFELRVQQFNGCLLEIKDVLFFGKGYGWHNYYMIKNVIHPTIMAFESLVFVVLCDSGIVGAALWIFVFYLIVRYNNANYSKDIASVLNATVVFYYSYACITGEYEFMKYFVLVYTLILGSQELKSKNNI